MMFEDTFIFFDANSLEIRFSNYLFLSKLNLSQLYYQVEKMIKDLELEKKVHLCIPEVVWIEMLEHLKKGYKSERQSFETKIGDYKKSFGDLVKIDYEFQLPNDEFAYSEYIEKSANDLLSEKRILAEIIPYPKDSRTMENLLNKATHSKSPFTNAKGIGNRGKEYSDAGFKDALIFETIVQTVNDGFCIFVTQDMDFNNAFKELAKDCFMCVSSLDEIKDFLIKNYKIVDVDYLESLMKSNKYIWERVLDETGFDVDANCVFEGIDNVGEGDEGHIFDMKLRINGDVYTFNLSYNMVANELIEASLVEV